MTPVWLKKYYEYSGELIDPRTLKDWNFENYVTHKKIFHGILREDNFFFNLDPFPGAVEYINKLVEEDFDVVFLTQLPRKSDFAAKDKRNWIKKFLPNFDLENLIFAHRKLLVHGDVLFDDNPRHIDKWGDKWRENWCIHVQDLTAPPPITATIDYLYNKEQYSDWRFMNKDTAWKEFYEKVSDRYKNFR